MTPTQRKWAECWVYLDYMREKRKGEQLMDRISEKIENLHNCVNAVCWSKCAAASIILMMTIALGSIASMSYQSQLKIKDLEPTVISVSHKIWDLVKDEDFVSAAIKQFKFPVIKNEEGELVYHIWDIAIDQVSLNGSEFSFPDMSDGIYIQAKNMQFHMSAKAELELREKIIVWIRLPKIKGQIGVKLSNVSLDVKLAWNDFKFTPNITMKCDASVDSSKMELVDVFKKQADEIITAKLNEKLPQMLTNMVNEKINPYLQKLKKLMTKYGICKLYNINLETKQDSIQVKMERKNGNGSMPVIRNLNKMIHIYGNLASAAVPAFNVIADFVVKYLEEILKDEEIANSLLNPIEVLQNLTEAMQNPTEEFFAFHCLDTKFECEQLLCEYSTDINVNLTSLGAKSDIKSCIPMWPTSYARRLETIFPILLCVLHVLV